MNETMRERRVEVEAALPNELAVLKERSCQVLVWRADGWSLRRIGDELGITTERVRQIEASALRRLRALALARPGYESIAIHRWTTASGKRPIDVVVKETTV